MYKTLIKSNRAVIKEQEAVVIDTNALIAKKLESLARAGMYANDAAYGADYAAAGEADDGLDGLLENREGDEMGGFTQGLGSHAKTVEVVPQYTGPSPEELIEQAREQIDAMKREAADQIERERESALVKGHKEGYEAGYREGLCEVDAMKAQLEEERAQMQQEYSRLIDELEPRFMETLTGIYEHVLHTDLSSNKQVILYLAQNALRNIDSSKEFLVHVSAQDYAAVNAGKQLLIEAAAGSNVSLEVVQDSLMSEGECMIETDGGIFDCGLGTQLSELSKMIKQLSYSGE